MKRIVLSHTAIMDKDKDHQDKWTLWKESLAECVIVEDLRIYTLVFVAQRSRIETLVLIVLITEFKVLLALLVEVPSLSTNLFGVGICSCTG
jgi:hypothetical protein